MNALPNQDKSAREMALFMAVALRCCCGRVARLQHMRSADVYVVQCPNCQRRGESSGWRDVAIKNWEDGLIGFGALSAKATSQRDVGHHLPDRGHHLKEGRA